MTEKLLEALESAKIAQRTIAGWARDEHGRVNVHPDVISKAVKALVVNLEAALAQSEPGQAQVGCCDNHRWLHEKDHGPSLPPFSFPCKNWQAVSPEPQGEAFTKMARAGDYTGLVAKARLEALEEAAKLGHKVAFEFLGMDRDQREYSWHDVEDALSKATDAIRALALEQAADKKP